MSWWDTSGLTSFASNVVKSAQKKIDKVLDIDEEPGTAASQSSSSTKKAAETEGDFWNTWLGSPSDERRERSSKTAKSSTSKDSSGTKGASRSWRSWGIEESAIEVKQPSAEGTEPRSSGTPRTSGLLLSAKSKKGGRLPLTGRERKSEAETGAGQVRDREVECGGDKVAGHVDDKDSGCTERVGSHQRLTPIPDGSNPGSESDVPIPEQCGVKVAEGSGLSGGSPAELLGEDDSSLGVSPTETAADRRPEQENRRSIQQYSSALEGEDHLVSDTTVHKAGVCVQEPDLQSLSDRTSEVLEPSDIRDGADRTSEVLGPSDIRDGGDRTSGVLGPSDKQDVADRREETSSLSDVHVNQTAMPNVSQTSDAEGFPERDSAENVVSCETATDTPDTGLTEDIANQTEIAEDIPQTGSGVSQVSDASEQRVDGDSTAGLLSLDTPDDKVEDSALVGVGQSGKSEQGCIRDGGGETEGLTGGALPQVIPMEDTPCIRATGGDSDEWGKTDTHLECIPETAGLEDTGAIDGLAESDIDGLPVRSEPCGEAKPGSDDLVTEGQNDSPTSQVGQGEGSEEAVPIITQVTGMLLGVADQILDRSASTSSSMEIVSETEMERSKDSRVFGENTGRDMDVSSPAPAGSAAVQLEQADTILDTLASEGTMLHGEGDNSVPSSPGGAAVRHEQSDSSLDTCASMDTVVHREGDNSDENMEEESEEKEAELSASDGCSMTVSSSSSVVKTMLEEAMEDNLKHEECDSHSHSSSDKSDFVKSEFSDKSISGHESGDEIDTTTSSDIEIISTPTPNGDGQGRLFDLSPLKIALSHANRRGSPKHRRSDSQSSSSTNSKPEQLSPGRDMEFSEEAGDPTADLSGHSTRSSNLMAEETSNNPNETEKLLKVSACYQESKSQDATGAPDMVTDEKMSEMAEVINARENKLVQLSKENNDLLEANSILRNQLKQSEEAHELEMEDVNALTEEFTQRLGEAERKLQMSLKEKESLKKQLEITQVEMVKKGDTSKFQKMLAEKDEQIQELLTEGEKLSKQQLQGSTIIKKLRSKEKETDQLIKSQKQKLESQSSELKHLRMVLDSKEDMEKKQTDAISQLNNAVQRQEKEIARLKAELEDNHEKVRGMQTALDTSYKEIAELHRANAAKDSQAQEVAVSAEMQAREELRLTMERENQRYRQEKEGLIMQIEDLRLSLSRMEKEHGRREDMLRQEISDLQQRLQEDEARNQELTQSVTSATRPLLRQIENLQSTYMAQSSSWETVEKNITERLGEAQTQLAVATEKERVSSEKVLELTAQVTALEAQNTRYRQEKSQLTAQNEMLKAKVEMLEDGKNNERAQIEAIRQSLSQEISELKREKILLENQLEMVKTKAENEAKKVALLQEQLKEKEKERPRSRGTPSPAQMSRQESISSTPDPLSQLPAFTQEELLERSLMLSPMSPNGNKLTLYETLRQTGAANLLESLTSQLKQREGEITQLQSEIAGLERTRESMARELVNLSTQNDDLKDQIDGLPQLEANHADLEQRYNALLQMYGEKVEETEELKLDLQDVKELYKSQIDHLMKAH